MLNLDDDNFMLYCAKCYDSPHLLKSEFMDDVKRIVYVKRLLRKYRQTGELKERLVLNHIIVMGNVFGVEPTVNILLHKVDKEDYPALKTILLYLNYWPDRIKVTINNEHIQQEDISIDLGIAGRLRNI